MTNETTATTFDFQDGNGPVPAHRHLNGGGWVANTAYVAETAFVRPDAWVFQLARVYDFAQVDGAARIFSKAQVYDSNRVYLRRFKWGEETINLTSSNGKTV